MANFIVNVDQKECLYLNKNSRSAGAPFTLEFWPRVLENIVSEYWFKSAKSDGGGGVGVKLIEDKGTEFWPHRGVENRGFEF
jgi:hypothetical protein